MCHNLGPAVMQKLRNEAKRAEALDAKKKHMQSFVDKFRFNAKRASLVQSRLKAIERLGDVQMMDRDPEYVFNFPFPDVCMTQDAVGFTDVSFNYPSGPTLFRNLSFGIALETRAAIVGPNGVAPTLLPSPVLLPPGQRCTPLRFHQFHGGAQATAWWHVGGVQCPGELLQAAPL